MPQMSSECVPSPPKAEQHIRAAQDTFEVAFRKRYPAVWLSTLLGPFVLSLIVLAWLYYTHDAAYLWKILGAATATFFVFGKFVILGGHAGELGEIERFLSCGELTFMVIYMDVMTALVLVYHMGFVFRIPFLGSKMAELVEDGEFILESSPWMRRATFIGLVAFIVFPLTATGAVGGAIFARLLGMTRTAALSAICIGSVLGCGLMYYGAGLVQTYLDPDNPLVMAAGISVILGMLFLLNWRYRQMKNAHFERRERQREALFNDVEPV